MNCYLSFWKIIRQYFCNYCFSSIVSHHFGTPTRHHLELSILSHISFYSPFLKFSLPVTNLYFNSFGLSLQYFYLSSPSKSFVSLFDILFFLFIFLYIFILHSAYVVSVDLCSWFSSLCHIYL